MTSPSEQHSERDDLFSYYAIGASPGATLDVGFPRQVLLADVNRDGRPDLIAGTAAAPYVQVQLGKGDGTFQSALGVAADSVGSLAERGMRLLEEAIEAFQAAGGAPAIAHKLVDHVFARPVGELAQELGGVGVTTLALAHAAGINADAAELAEVERILGKPLDFFRARHAQKVAAGFTGEPRASSRPVRNSKTGLRSRYDAEVGDPVPGRNFPGLSYEEWLDGMTAAGWDEFAADGWASGPVRWVKISEARS